MDPHAAKARLIRLMAERFQALELGVENPSPYLTRLEDAIEHARAEYVTSAVLEIAVMRRDMTGATLG